MMNKQHKVKSITRKTYAVMRCSKHRMYEASVGIGILGSIGARSICSPFLAYENTTVTHDCNHHLFIGI